MYLFAIIVDDFRDLELRWVEILADGREGLATPYFDTYFDNVFRFNLELKPSEENPQQV